MNCRPGDLAVFVRSDCGNEGKIVRCISLLTPAEILDGQWASDTVWNVDTLVLDTYGELSKMADDECLRPIRPGDISDEEVRDLYLPKVPEHA